GIRDATVTGVQTCALPIFDENAHDYAAALGVSRVEADLTLEALVLALQRECERALAVNRDPLIEGGNTQRRLKLQFFSFERPVKIGRASCRERVEMSVSGG